MSYFGVPNKYEDIGGGVSKIYITSRLHGVVEGLVDSEDIPRLKAFHWCVAKLGHTLYLTSSIGNRYTGDYLSVKLHRLVTSFEFPIVDHKNRNGLDNRKINLREGTNQGNSANSKHFRSKTLYRGIKINPSGKCYPRIKVNGEYIYLGVFSDVVLAAKAYDEAARKYHGEFAYQNFPPQKEILCR
jgi:hypothetical protein